MNANPTPRPGNLRPPWKPGQSGNPTGYSRARRRQDALVRLLESGMPAADLAEALDREGLAREVAETLLRLALSGHVRSFMELLYRVDGPSPGARYRFRCLRGRKR